jgi:hypothetical protein
VTTLAPEGSEPYDIPTLAGYWGNYSFRLFPVWDEYHVPGWSPIGKFMFCRECRKVMVGWMACPN